MHIVVEGLPGSGKTTLVNSLTKGTDFVKIDEMIVPIAETADEFMYVEHDIAKCVLRDYHENTVMDRSYLSTLGYNFANDKYTGSNNFLRIKNRISEELDKGRLSDPDLLIYLTSSIETSLLRQKPENASFWRVHEMLRYSEQYVLEYLTINHGGNVVYIDGTQSKEEVQNQAKAIISSWANRVAYGY